ncbi:MAG: hypothetical protein EZS28_006569 [Streblomastix strix]|uniref:Uncharacterized protein n=1 Tax=Streblomastix strix TaxID=222440 RepID=A0A5J4WSW4_9EUKA|nr:MAG: hypothetical protein EZS28_006569 [Streblomastix strix]
MNFEEHLAKLNQQYSLPGAQSFAQPQNSIKPPKPSIDRNVQSTRNIDFFQPLAYAEQFDQEDIDVNLNEMHSEIMFAAFVETIDISRKSHTDQSHVAFADDWSRQKKEILASFGQQGNQWVPPDMKMNNIEQNKVVIQLDQPIKKDEDMKERLQNEILAKFYEVAHEYCMIRKDHYEGLEQYRNWGRIRNQKILEINMNGHLNLRKELWMEFLFGQLCIIVFDVGS